MKTVAKIKLIALLPLFISVAVPADTFGRSVSIGEIIASALNDQELSSRNDQKSFLKNNTENPSFIQDPELRVSIDKFEKNEQKYTFRFTPAAPSERKRERELQSAMIRSGDVSCQSALHAALKKRYELVAEYQSVSMMVDICRKLALVLDDEENALKRFAGRIDFDPEDFADAENRRIKLDIDLAELLAKKSALESELVGYAFGAGDGLHVEDIEIDYGNSVSIESMRHRVISIPLDITSDNVNLMILKADADEAEAELRLREAEEKRVINYIEAGYSADENSDMNRAVSIEFGIALPFFSSSKRSDLNRKKLPVIRSRGEFISLKEDLQKQLLSSEKGFESLVDHYLELENGKKSGISDVLYSEYAGTGAADPFVVLRLKEKSLKKDMMLSRLRGVICEKYISILDISGKMSESPLRNYMAEQLEVLN